MTTLERDTHVARIARELPNTIKVFQRHRIDFCCGGKRPLATACAEAGVDTDDLLAELRVAAAGPAAERDWSGAALPELIAHIVQRYHGGTRRDLPVAQQLAAKVATRHGEGNPQLVQVSAVVEELAAEMTSHMMKEEVVLFPMIERLAGGAAAPGMPVEGPIAAMEHEHDLVGELFTRLRALTAGYQPPPQACNSYRGLFQLLADLEAETQMHIHLENNVLFPRAEELAGAPV
jgi:regulator of cell morphogenesis and NO signaling